MFEQIDISRLLLEESPDSSVVLTAQGAIAHWSHGAQSVYGHARDVVQGKLFSDLVVPQDQLSDHRQRLAETLANGSTTYESVRRRLDGSLLYVDVSGKRLAAGSNSPLVLLAEKDVTHIKVQRDAKLMEARFRDLLESTPDGIVMANPTGHIVIANSQAERLFGYAAGELRGKSVDSLLPQRYRQAHVGHRSNYFLQPRKRAMGSGLDLAGLRKDGTEFPIEISLSPLHTEESAFVMSAIRDISERKNFEKALQEKNAELANANQAKDRFLASMSHELRTPLNAIIGFTGTLLMRLPGPLTGDQEKHLRTVQGSARHLLALINDLLDVAKIEAGKQELRLQPLSCLAVVEEVAATLRPLAENKGLSFELLCPVPIKQIVSDRRAISQIVLNLLSNAIKFTPAGGIRLVVSQQDHGGEVLTRVQVEDSGAGMNATEQAALFTPFSRLQSGGMDAIEGTGLGLHLSQKLARLLGGEILVDSAKGRGSSFTLLLREQLP